MSNTKEVPTACRLSGDEISCIYDTVSHINTSNNDYNVRIYRTDGTELEMPRKMLINIQNTEHVKHINTLYMTMMERNIHLILSDYVELFQSFAPIVKSVFSRHEPVKALSFIVDGKCRVKIINDMAKGDMCYAVILTPKKDIILQNINSQLEISHKRYKRACFVLLVVLLVIIFCF